MGRAHDAIGDPIGFLLVSVSCFVDAQLGLQRRACELVLLALGAARAGSGGAPAGALALELEPDPGIVRERPGSN
jgi:hypothetical protein